MELEKTDDFKLVKLKGVKKLMAEKMSESLQKQPQLTAMGDVDCTNLLLMKKKMEQEHGEKISITAFYAKAVAHCITKQPLMNSLFVDPHFHLYDAVHIGFAYAGKNGLCILVVRDVQDKSVPEISKELKQLQNKLEEGTITLEEMTGATFTISNVGMFSVRYFTPVLNFPQSALLGVGRAVKTPIVNKDGEIEIRNILPLSLTFNHALIEGENAARFLTEMEYWFGKIEEQSL